MCFVSCSGKYRNYKQNIKRNKTDCYICTVPREYHTQYCSWYHTAHIHTIWSHQHGNRSAHLLVLQVWHTGGHFVQQIMILLWRGLADKQFSHQCFLIQSRAGPQCPVQSVDRNHHKITDTIHPVLRDTFKQIRQLNITFKKRTLLTYHTCTEKDTHCTYMQQQHTHTHTRTSYIPAVMYSHNTHNTTHVHTDTLHTVHYYTQKGSYIFGR